MQMWQILFVSQRMVAKMLFIQLSIIPSTLQNTLGVDGIVQGQNNLLVNAEYVWCASTLLDLFSY